MSAQDLRMRFPEAGQADTCTPAPKGVNQAMRCSNFSRKALTVVLAAMLTLSVLGTASCTDGIDSTGSATATAGETASDRNDTDAETDTENVTQTESAAETETDTKDDAKEKPIMFDQLTQLDKETTPFWKTNVMYNEAATFIVREDGSITAKLYFQPTAILSVKSNDLKTTFTEGVDYTWDKESNILTLPAGSSIPYFTQNDIHGKDADGNYIPDFGSSTPWDEQGRSRFGNALYCVGEFLYAKQIAVT